MAVAALSSWRTDAAHWLHHHRVDLLILSGVWLLAAVGYYLLARGYVTPRHQQDEFLYWALAKSFAAGDGFTWRGVNVPLRSFLYPVSIAPAFELASSVQGRLDLVHAINSLMMTATVFPAFFMARLFVDRSAAYVAAAFAILVPAMNYTGLVGTETLAYPTCTAALAAILLACAVPRARNTVLAVALIALAVVTRTQFVVLMPIFFASIVLVAMMRGREGAREFLSQQKLALAMLGAGLLLILLLLLVARDSVIGIYGGLFTTIPLTAGNASFWTKSFAADVFLVVAVVPAIATFALIATRKNRRDPRIGALIALAYLATLLLVAQVAWFSATSPEYWRVLNLFYERYIFYLGPIFFTGLMAARGRVSPRAAIITSLVALVVISGFQADTLATPFSYEAFGLTYLSYFVSNHEGPFTQVGLLAAGVSALLAIVYICSTIDTRHESFKRYAGFLAIALPLLVLVITQARAWSYGHLYAADSKSLQPQPVSFVQRATRDEVGMIVPQGTERIEYFQDEFWNPNLTRLFVSGSPPVSSPPIFTPHCRFSWSASGRIFSKDCPQLPDAWHMRNEQLTMHLRGETRRVSSAGTAATVVFAPQPAQIFSFLSGRNPGTGLMKAQASVTTFLDQPGEVRLKLRSVRAARLKLAGGRAITLKANATTMVEFAVPAQERLVRLRLPADVSGVRMIDAEVREGDGPWQSLT
ncbi:MAG: hypothetical protein JHD02_05990 [Thermoleophilaceae bacterium]|nr:hypothetical protein [Thermoleophilaceae bacterium]